jgi:hypothetical protein
LEEACLKSATAEDGALELATLKSAPEELDVVHMRIGKQEAIEYDLFVILLFEDRGWLCHHFAPMATLQPS